jgi:hypothetical protein
LHVTRSRFESTPENAQVLLAQFKQHDGQASSAFCDQLHLLE